MRFLVTAGNTREAIDQVRDWGNVFTGNTGFTIAKALSEAGEVDLLTSNRLHWGELAGPSSARHSITASAFTCHAELKETLASLLTRHRYDAIFMTAAVSDYKPVRAFAVLERQVDANDLKVERWVVRDAQAGKVKSDHEAVAFLGRRSEKIVDLFRSQWKYAGTLVKFKLEVGIGKERLLEIGEASRLGSDADYLVANTLDMVAGEGAGAYLLYAGGHEWVSREDLGTKMAEIATRRR